MYRSKNFFLNSILIIISLFIPVIFTEIYLRFIYKDWKKYDEDRFEYRSRKPKAYQNSKYFSDEFIKESSSVKWYYNKSDIGIIEELNGEFININSSGIRKTTNKLDIGEKKDFTINFYGGSTVFGQEVPDEYTLPSMLSKLIIKECKSNVQVINYGIPSVRTDEQIILLKKKKQMKGDINIFYDLYNDIHYNFYFNNQNGDSSLKIYKNYIQVPKQVNIPYKKLQKYLTHLNLPKKIINQSSILSLLTAKSIVIKPYKNHSNELAKIVAYRYWENIKEADEFSRLKEVDFFHFMQPSIYQAKIKSSDSKYILDHPLISAPEESAIYRIALKEIRNLYKEKYARSIINSTDLTNIFSDIDAASFFLDQAHINEYGNQEVAKKIFQEIKIIKRLKCES